MITTKTKCNTGMVKLEYLHRENWNDGGTRNATGWRHMTTQDFEHVQCISMALIILILSSGCTLKFSMILVHHFSKCLFFNWFFVFSLSFSWRFYVSSIDHKDSILWAFQVFGWYTIWTSYCFLFLRVTRTRDAVFRFCPSCNFPFLIRTWEQSLLALPPSQPLRSALYLPLLSLWKWFLWFCSTTIFDRVALNFVTTTRGWLNNLETERDGEHRMNVSPM